MSSNKLKLSLKKTPGQNQGPPGEPSSAQTLPPQARSTRSRFKAPTTAPTKSSEAGPASAGRSRAASVTPAITAFENTTNTATPRVFGATMNDFLYMDTWKQPNWLEQQSEKFLRYALRCLLIYERGSKTRNTELKERLLALQPDAPPCAQYAAPELARNPMQNTIDRYLNVHHPEILKDLFLSSVVTPSLDPETPVRLDIAPQAAVEILEKYIRGAFELGMHSEYAAGYNAGTEDFTASTRPRFTQPEARDRAAATSQQPTTRTGKRKAESPPAPQISVPLSASHALPAPDISLVNPESDAQSEKQLPKDMAYIAALGSESLVSKIREVCSEHRKLWRENDQLRGIVDTLEA